MNLIAPASPATGLRHIWAVGRRAEPRLARATLIYLALCIPLTIAMAFDERTVLGINVWIKPLKFHLSIVAYFAVFVWLAAHLQEATTRRTWFRLYSGLLITCASLELIWVTAASAFGIASHFNVSTPMMSFAYTMAGIGAVILITAAPVYAVLLWRTETPGLQPPLRSGVLAGLVLTFPLTFVAAGYLGGAGSHFVGGSGSDAAGMPLTGWSRDGGDLRVAHFFALHAIHVLPAFGLIAGIFGPLARHMVWGCAAAYAALTVFTFRQAIRGEPFIPFL